MKHRHLIALLQEGYTTIQVVFNDDVRGRSKPYTYKAPLSAGVEVGDRVVVDSPSKGLVVVEVVGTDKAPRSDLDADFTYKWIVQKVALKAYEEQLEREAALMAKLEAVEKERDGVAWQLAQSEQGKRKISEERDALQAKVEAMEQQEPVYLFRRKGWEEFCTCSKERYEEFYTNPRVFEVKKLCLAPGAKGETK